MAEGAAALPNIPSGGGQLFGPGAEFAAARALNADRLASARQPAAPPPEEELAASAAAESLASEEQEAQAQRALLARRRTAQRAATPDATVELVKETTRRIKDGIAIVTAVIEWETVIVPLQTLGWLWLRFIGGNMGILSDFMYPAVEALEKALELESGGALKAVDVGSTVAAGGGGSAGRVEKIHIEAIAVMVLVTLVLALLIMVNFIIFFAVPIAVLAAIGGVCAGFTDFCTSLIDTLGSAYHYISSLFGTTPS